MLRVGWKRAKPSAITLGDRARDARQWDLAGKYYWKALQRKSDNPPIWVQYGHVLKESGHLAEAERAYRTAVAYDGHTADPYLHLGHVLKIQGKKGEAQASYLHAYALDPALRDLLRELDSLGWSEAHFAELHSMVRSGGLQPLEREMPEGDPPEGEHSPVCPIPETGQIDPYMRWVRECDTLDDADRVAIRAHIAELARRPLISVVVPVYNTEEKYLREMIESVLQQIYPYWELCLADDASTKPHVEQVLREFAVRDLRIKFIHRETNGHICAATNAALDLAVGEFVALLDHDDLLSETALYEIAVEVDAHPDADVIYSDSDNIDDSGRRSVPYFKTDWNPDLMLGHNMVSHLGVYRRSLVEEVGRLRVGFEGSQDYDLMLRVLEASAPSRIRHIPAVLYHWRRNAAEASFSEASLERCVVAARRAIREHLERTGVQARIDVPPKCPSWTRVVYSLPPARPLVSVIVPTRDKADLLARCADGVLTRTDYEPLELVIVDNDSVEPETHRLLTHLANDPRVRIIRHPGRFNYPAINNRAVQEARGDIVVLMNNDVDVISPMWLEEMVSHALRQEIGAVGAKLLYPDGLVQHAGVVLGVGHGAGHFFHGAPGDAVGCWGFLSMVRRVSAVSAACMALRRHVYLEVGGMDEAHFPVAFNDVDLCLRIGERGYGVVWTPHAELFHVESATRGADTDEERASRLKRDAEQLRQRWEELLDRDPFYNQNCSLAPAFFEPGFPSRRPRPWLSPKERLQAPHAAMSRAEVLLAGIDRLAHIIEIGPSFNPIAPKADGWNTRTLDHATRAALVEKYRGHPGVDVDRIEEVDFVWSSGPMTDVVPTDLHGTFDAFIASHVIEHTTNLVGFLETAETLLARSGVVILAVPDKRFCFDYFRPLTTTAQVLEAHAARRSRHTRRIAFDHIAYVVNSGGAGAWGQAPVEDLGFRFYDSLEKAGDVFSKFSADPNLPYTDFHAWQFVPASFELLILELARLGETDWRIERITPAIGCEFHVRLRRGGKAAAAALTEAQVNAQRLALLKRTLLETREQIDFAFGRREGSPRASMTNIPSERTPTPFFAMDAPASFKKFELRTPSYQNALDIFDGKWASDFADVRPRLRAGRSPLFTLDTRPRDAARLLGINDRLDGMRVLELGPLEGAHTYQLEKLGAASILAIEANAEAFLKCLITKEITGLRAATFMHGDFSEYLKEPNERFDLVFCSGVLYHMADPLALIESIAKITERCFVWTHYYDRENYAGPPREARSDLRYPGVRIYALEYNDMDSDRFWGGNRPTSVWLERNDIVSAFRRVGFHKVDVIDEAPDHPNGACFSFAAQRLVATEMRPPE